MSDLDDTTGAGQDVDRRLRAIEAELRTISRWVTALGYLAVALVLVLVVNWLVALTS